MEGLLWNKREHYRFGRKDRAFVRFLVWLFKSVSLIPKDVWIYHIIPHCVNRLIIPNIYVGNLPFSYTFDDLKARLNIPIENGYIAFRRNGISKGFGIFRLLNYDDYEKFGVEKGSISIHIDNRQLVFAKYHRALDL